MYRHMQHFPLFPNRTRITIASPLINSIPFRDLIQERKCFGRIQDLQRQLFFTRSPSRRKIGPSPPSAATSAHTSSHDSPLPVTPLLNRPVSLFKFPPEPLVRPGPACRPGHTRTPPHARPAHVSDPFMSLAPGGSPRHACLSPLTPRCRASHYGHESP
jgi:hypothetical protein